MKVAFITFEYPPNLVGGTGTYAKYIVKELAQLGHEVHVITPSNGEQKDGTITDKITVHRIKNVNIPYFSAILSMLKLRPMLSSIHNEVGGFDIIHENSQHAFQLLLQFFPKRIIRIPHLITVHTLSYQSICAERPTASKRIIDRGEKNYLTEFSEKTILKKADILVANSLYTKKILVSQYGIPNSKTRVVYMGHPELNLIEFGVELRRKLALTFGIVGEPIILFVGRLVHRKGLPYLLKAARELRNREVKFKLIVVGTGPEKERYEAQVKELRLEQVVFFTGFVDDAILKRLYLMSDVVTVPSINEPFGLVILEAMVAKKPIVASMSGGIPEIIDSPLNGALINPQNTTEYADALQLFLEDKKTCIRVGELNYKKVTEKFTWKGCARQLSSIYETLLKLD